MTTTTSRPSSFASVDELARTYERGGERIVALDGVSFTLEEGETVAVVGPSGSGKSTLLHVLGAMDSPTSGRVVVDGVEVTGLAGEARAAYRRRLGFVFQQHHLLPTLGALENLVAAVAPWERRRTAVPRARALLAAVGLADRERALPAQLSGGQQQRVAVARAFMHEPRLVLADEPTGNLDRDTGAAVVDLLLGRLAGRGTTLVLVTHDEKLADRCDRTLRLDRGRLTRDVRRLADPVQGI